MNGYPLMIGDLQGVEHELEHESIYQDRASKLKKKKKVRSKKNYHAKSRDVT